MTIITAYKGVMAADTLVSWGDGGPAVKVCRGQKLARIDGHLFGVAGDDVPSTKEAAEAWLSNELFTTKYVFTLLIVKPDRSIWLSDERLSAECVGDRDAYFAIGSGAEIAFGAFWMGACATLAAEAAISHGLGCGGSVDYVKI